ncbi:MAG: zinc-ribbon domain-containing protein [Candidatus Helarchaeota archaeon]
MIVLNYFFEFFLFILPWVIILGILIITMVFLITRIVNTLEWRILEFQINQKFCNQCGYKLLENVNYCPKCNTNLSILEIILE